jgi:hypothetical protein
MTVYSGYGLNLDSDSYSWSWTLVDDSLAFHVVICLIYCLSVYGMKTFVASKTATELKALRERWNLDSIKFVHNIALSIVSLFMGIVMIHSVYKDGRFQSWHNMACNNTANTGAYGRANWIYLLTKIWEWMDTMWLILDAKPVITLHWFHHMTTFTMAAFTHNFPVGGFAFINSFVHFIMYLHFARPIKFIRPFITSFQLIQFMTVISIHTYGYMHDEGSGGNCFNFSDVQGEWWYCQSVVAGYFILFVKFFIDNYVSKGSKKSKKEE